MAALTGLQSSAQDHQSACPILALRKGPKKLRILAQSHRLERYSLNSIHRLLWHRSSLPPWNDGAPVREELFSVERLEQHAESLAAAQPVTDRPPTVRPLHTRLNDNAAVLLAAYRASAAELERGKGVVPAAVWLLDNYHLVEEQIDRKSVV